MMNAHFRPSVGSAVRARGHDTCAFQVDTMYLPVQVRTFIFPPTCRSRRLLWRQTSKPVFIECDDDGPNICQRMRLSIELAFCQFMYQSV